MTQDCYVRFCHTTVEPAKNVWSPAAGPFAGVGQVGQSGYYKMQQSAGQPERYVMAQPANPKKPSKRPSQKSRREAQEAAKREEQEKAAKERHQQTIIGVIVVVVVVALLAVIGVAVYRSVQKDKDASMDSDDAYSQLQAVENKPSAANDQGGILLSNQGVGQQAADVPTIAVYMDPLCPGCQNFDLQTGPTLKTLLDAGQANLEIYPLSFLDQGSTDNYSSRASGSIYYIASNDDNPDHLLDYISNLYAEDFQPEEGSGYKSVSDDQLKEQAIKAGVPDDVADGAFSGEYQDWLDALNVYTPKRSELFNTSGSYKGSMTTPTVTINGTYLDLSTTSEDLPLINLLLNSIGLSEDAVGDSSTLPSIGSSGQPLTDNAGDGSSTDDSGDTGQDTEE